MRKMATKSNESGSQEFLFKAVKYVRMSTEHQQYSTENQSQKIDEYAAKSGIQILRTYADEGKSGLRIEGRLGLQELLRVVNSGQADFKIILVYDISRWGRFQDPDEGAYYEHVCRRKGIDVIYCAEGFTNDGSPVSTIVKGVKRAMAGEYSRELSTKVFAGQCRLIELGYRQGGLAGFGLRRVLLDQSGEIKAELARGEHKSLQTDRVILMPGPDSEVKVVNQIYDWFINGGLVEAEIAKKLNDSGISTDLGRPWTRGTVHQILINEKYIGNNVYNRVSFKLKKNRVVNVPEKWVKKEAAFEAIVSSETFYTAQGMIRARIHRYTDEEMLEKLRSLYKNRGLLSGLIINETDGMPSTSAYVLRFGSLIRAYEAVGFSPDRDYRYLEVNRHLRELYPQIVKDTELKIQEVGGMIVRDISTDLLQVNNEFSVSIVLCRCQQQESGNRRWKVRFDTSLQPDITVAVRLDRRNQDPLDYYLLPSLDFGSRGFNLAERNSVEFESYRFENLDYLYGMAQRTRVRRAA